MPPKHVVAVTTDIRTYDVRSRGTDIHDFFTALFNDGALCACVEKEHVALDSCDEATAYTSWALHMEQPLLYGADGKQRALRLAVKSTVMLPVWANAAAAPADDRAEAMRANLRTAHHEAGHRLTSEQLAKSIIACAEHMPGRVLPAAVDRMNGAFDAICSKFYSPMARRADVRYDAATTHGMVQGGQYADVVEVESTDVPSTVSGGPPRASAPPSPAGSSDSGSGSGADSDADSGSDSGSGADSDADPDSDPDSDSGAGTALRPVRPAPLVRAPVASPRASVKRFRSLLESLAAQ
jgi:hypothetical protein